MGRRTFRVAEADAGKRLDVIVAAGTDVPRAAAARLIASGAVTVDGARLAKSATLAAGARVEVVLEEGSARAPAGDPPFEVRYRDEDLLVVAKPPGVVVHPAPGHESGTLADALAALGAAGGDSSRPGIVHRLDADTSGLMVVARSERAYEALVAAMKRRSVERTYLALVVGEPSTETLTIDAPLGRSPKHRKRMAVVAGGKPARTEVAVLERLGRCALVEARPRTGRTHQIRVHLAAAGYPVVGDAVYGRSRALAASLGLERQFLHAARLAFSHPVTGAPIDLAEPLPEDLARALDAARAR